ncbi:hypothetical protein B7R21_14240 [Subtercola boreus]|uniref:DUF559 domain-containing protein n=1 Tax=Subtercola boreus TaxID=120213 RepID=A0A3E0VDA3_9MICO|nr:hypothetical protein [Subtercola boreus]RFA07370.1 hypothetical protein B7R21_14240 [Subtercola boreus]
MNDFAPELLPWPGVVHGSQLSGRGIAFRDLQRACRAGFIRRIARGWYALPDAHITVVRAVRAGGSLTGPSAARLYGLWVPPDLRLHVAVPSNSSTVPSVSSRSSDLCVHWLPDRGRLPIAIQPIPAALDHAISCCTPENAVAIVDSALNKRLVTIWRLRASVGSRSEKHRRVIDRSDPASESGLESLVRYRLASLRIGVRTQARRRGVGRVDLLVGDRFVIELDGRAFHDDDRAFAVDHERNLELFRTDHLNLRLTYEHVMFRWPEIERIILHRVRRREHRWRSSQTPQEKDQKRMETVVASARDASSP